MAAGTRISADTLGDEATIDELARAAQQGDELARARLLAAVRPRILRWAIVHSGAPDDAEDITQHALLTIHRQLSSFAHGSRFTTWLYTLTRRIAADWQRTRSRRIRLLETRAAPQEHTMQRHDAYGSLLALVRAQLAGLPARQRELFDLVDLQGYTPLEAADLLGMNHNTARVHVLRARRTIRKRILAAHPNAVEELR
jgi:RNA polymerase sigma-70 factor (ECF subfamily)